MKALIYLILFMIVTSLHALEVDEKLTLRFLKVSSTKKTVLVNRGAEDGLVAGNHAKFFTTAGVVARGVVEKVSPSRSIWSLYRIIDTNEITDGKVLNLKIGTPVKISEDSTKSLNNEVVPSGNDKISIPKTNAQTKAPTNEVDSFEADTEDAIPTQEDNKSYSAQKPMIESSSLSGDEWEVWGNASANMLSGTSSNMLGTVSSSTTASSSTIDYSVGIEKYFFKASGFMNQLSLTGFLHSRNSKLGQDIQITETMMEFGAGIRYHFNNSASLVNGLMPFALLDAGVGSSTVQAAVTTSTTPADPATKGSSKFYAIGGGTKYILGYGLGFKAIIDYYSSNETYAFTTTTGTRTLAGVRLQAGLSYRF